MVGELSSTIISELSRRLQSDVKAYANVCDAFGVKRFDTFEEMITLSPATPLRFLKNVFKVLVK